MLTALNYCTADFPRQGELRLQLQKMQSCSIFLTILHQAMQRKMSTKPHFWTYLSQIPFLYLSKPLFCICRKSLFLFVTNLFSNINSNINPYLGSNSLYLWPSYETISSLMTPKIFARVGWSILVGPFQSSQDQDKWTLRRCVDKIWK